MKTQMHGIYSFYIKDLQCPCYRKETTFYRKNEFVDELYFDKNIPILYEKKSLYSYNKNCLGVKIRFLSDENKFNQYNLDDLYWTKLIVEKTAEGYKEISTGIVFRDASRRGLNSQTMKDFKDNGALIIDESCIQELDDYTKVNYVKKVLNNDNVSSFLEDINTFIVDNLEKRYEDYKEYVVCTQQEIERANEVLKPFLEKAKASQEEGEKRKAIEKEIARKKVNEIRNKWLNNVLGNMLEADDASRQKTR